VDRKTVQSGDPNTSSQISSVISSGISRLFKAITSPKSMAEKEDRKSKRPQNTQNTPNREIVQG